jgi:hypothetical protein
MDSSEVSFQYCYDFLLPKTTLVGIGDYDEYYYHCLFSLSGFGLLSRNGSSQYHSENKKEGEGNANSYGVSFSPNSFSTVLYYTTLINSQNFYAVG